MTDQRYCPHCGSDQQGAEIPRNSLAYRADGEHYSRTVGVEIRGVYDGILFWSCPDCGGSWHRWPEGSWQYAKAVRYVEAAHE